MKVEATLPSTSGRITFNPKRCAAEKVRIPRGLYIQPDAVDKVFLISDGLIPGGRESPWSVVLIDNETSRFYLYDAEDWDANFIEAPAGTTITFTA